MNEELKQLKDIMPIAMPFIKSVIEVFIKPKMRAIAEQFKLEKKLLKYNPEIVFEEYLLRAYTKCTYVSTLVFQNQQKRIEDIYIPLNAVCSKDSKLYKLDQYRDEFVPTFKKLLLVDTAGMGKSTAMKWLFLSCIKQNKGVPIFIELRRLSKNRTILEEVYKELSSIEQSIDKSLILNLLKSGEFVFFFDGFDEISFSEKRDVIVDIQDFILKALKNHFIISSRHDDGLASFADFQEFKIKPLTNSESFELIRKYDNNGEKSKALIGDVKTGGIARVREFLSNPMLASLLYKAYEYKPVIPYKKHIFYRQVFESLFESHDLTKPGAFKREKYCGLDLHNFRYILKGLGYLTFKRGKVEYEKDEIISTITEVKNKLFPFIDFEESMLLLDLNTSVPLFIKDGEYYRWAHKSLQEYFAASFISVDAKNHQQDILEKIYESDKNYKYYNLMDLCYDIDYKTFRRVIIYRLLTDLYKYLEDSYKDIDRSIINEKEIFNRKLLTFGKRYYVRKLRLKERSNIKDAEFIRGDVINDIFDEMGTDRITNIKNLNNKIFLISGNSNISSILTLVGRKATEEIINYRLDPVGISKSINRCNKIIKKQYKCMVIDDNKDNIFNQDLIFSDINKILSSERNYINIEKCKKLLMSIKTELEIDKAGDVYMSDL